jgi:hypothetical protein
MKTDTGKYESPQVAATRVVAIVSGIVVILSLIAFGFEPLFHNRIGQTYTVHRAFPTPAVIPGERAQRLALEARQQRDLSGAHGRMPIAIAMKNIAPKGPHALDPIGGPP